METILLVPVKYVYLYKPLQDIHVNETHVSMQILKQKKRSQTGTECHFAIKDVVMKKASLFSHEFRVNYLRREVHI